MTGPRKEEGARETHLQDDYVAKFIRTYAPRSICLHCLASLMEHDRTSVTTHASRHVSAGHLVAHQGECLNCGQTRTVFRSP